MSNLHISPTEESKTKCYCGHTSYCDCGPLEPKQETLEEAAETFLPRLEVEHDTDFIIGFGFGAKWQQERMYSEEEVVNILIKAYEDIGKRKIPNQVVLASWFEQFKKK